MDVYSELAKLEEKIRQLSYVIANQRTATTGTRRYKAQLYKEYGISVSPSLVEMKKYPKLRKVEFMIKDGEKNLERMEVNMMWKQKRRKELMIGLGLREEDMP